jgi:hypothetical protein
MVDAGRCRTLRSRSWSAIGVAVDGCAAGCPAWRCRRVCTTLPPSRVSATPGRLRLPLSTSRVHRPSVRTVDVRRLRGPGAEPSRCPRTRHRGRVRGASDDAAGCWPDGRCPPRTRPQPCAGQGHRGPPVTDDPCTPADCGSGHRPPPADTARVSEMLCGTAATWRCRPDGWTVAAERLSGRLRNWTLQASAVHRCVRNRGRGPDGSCPPRTLPQSAGVGCYRNRSPARRSLDGCRHRR